MDMKALVEAIDYLRPNVHAIDRLRAVQRARSELDRWELEAVKEALSRGTSYGEIGRAVGVTRQVAHRRWSDPEDRATRKIRAAPRRGPSKGKAKSGRRPR
jgi:hypothetical protein